MRYNKYDRNADNLSGEFDFPERKLLIAVLKRAILDYLGPDQIEEVDARKWIYSAGADAHSPEFSFEWVCEQLSLDLEQVRYNIDALRDYEGPEGIKRFRFMR